MNPRFRLGETGGSHHLFILTKVSLHSHPIKHPYHRCQCRLNPDGVATCYSFVVHIEYYVVLSCCPTQPMIRLLFPSGFQKYHPYHCIHHDIENSWGDRIPLGKMLVKDIINLMRLLISDWSYPKTSSIRPKYMPSRYEIFNTIYVSRTSTVSTKLSLKNIYRVHLGVLAVLVNWKTSHIPYIVMARPVFPNNSGVLNVHKIWSSYSIIVFVYLAPTPCIYKVSSSTHSIFNSAF